MKTSSIYLHASRGDRPIEVALERNGLDESNWYLRFKRDGDSVTFHEMRFDVALRLYADLGEAIAKAEQSEEVTVR